MILKPQQSTQISEKPIFVDPLLYFQRLLDVVERTPDELENAFSYELSNILSSLFDSSGLPRLANKADLTNFIWCQTEVSNANSKLQEGVQLP